MIRLISFCGIAILFIFWALYKTFIDRKTSKQDYSGIKLGFIWIAIAGLIFYFIFSL